MVASGPRRAATTVLRHCNRPRGLRPRDLGLPYVVLVAADGRLRRYYGPDDDVADAIGID